MIAAFVQPTQAVPTQTNQRYSIFNYHFSQLTLWIFAILFQFLCCFPVWFRRVFFLFFLHRFTLSRENKVHFNIVVCHLIRAPNSNSKQVLQARGYDSKLYLLRIYLLIFTCPYSGYLIFHILCSNGFLLLCLSSKTSTNFIVYLYSCGF